MSHVVFRTLHIVAIFYVFLPEPPSPDNNVRKTYCSALPIRQERNKLYHIIKVCCQMLRSLIVIILKEEQTFSRQSRKIIRPTIREIRRCMAIVQVESPTKLGFKPLFCCPQPPLFFDRVKNLIQGKQLIFALALLSHKATNIFMPYIRVRVNGSVSDSSFIHKVIDKLGAV